MLKMSAIDIELLILTVEKFESLWKIDCPEYSNRNAKAQAWNNICEVMYNDWEQLDVNQKRIKST